MPFGMVEPHVMAMADQEGEGWRNEEECAKASN